MSDTTKPTPAISVLVQTPSSTYFLAWATYAEFKEHTFNSNDNLEDEGFNYNNSLPILVSHIDVFESVTMQVEGSTSENSSFIWFFGDEYEEYITRQLNIVDMIKNGIKDI